MKMLQYVEEGLIRQRVEIDEMQCGFMLGCGTTDAIFIVRQLQEKHLIASKPLYMAFVYLEHVEKKAFDCVHQDFIWLAMPMLGTEEVSVPGPVHVQGCKKPGKSKGGILPVIFFSAS